MRLKQLLLEDIIFDKKAYDQSLFDSVLRIGFSFPIKVRIENEQYYCKDGHKRLSVLSDILQQDPQYKRGHKVTVIIENSENVRSNDCWRGRNTH